MKFFFDNCVPRPIVEFLARLAQLEGELEEYEHLTESFDPPTPDAEWILKLNSRTGWVVVTLDRGKRERRAWADCSRPILFLGKGFANFRARQQALTLLRYWDKIRKWSRSVSDGEGRWCMRIRDGSISKAK